MPPIKPGSKLKIGHLLTFAKQPGDAPIPNCFARLLFRSLNFNRVTSTLSIMTSNSSFNHIVFNLILQDIDFFGFERFTFTTPEFFSFSLKLQILGHKATYTTCRRAPTSLDVHV